MQSEFSIPLDIPDVEVLAVKLSNHKEYTIRVESKLNSAAQGFPILIKGSIFLPQNTDKEVKNETRKCQTLK